MSYAVYILKEQLKDPNSLVIYGTNIWAEEGSDYFTIELDYGAKNGFGGMVRDNYSHEYKLTENEKNIIYQTLKEWMDSNGATIDDAAYYLSGNAYIAYDSIYEAIVNGTQTYY